MAEKIDLDLEIVEVGVVCNLYMLALVGLAIDLKSKGDATTARKRVCKDAKKLQNALSRCGVDQQIPVDVGGRKNILSLIKEEEVPRQIANSLVGKYDRRSESIFILSYLVCAVMGGDAGGISEATGPVKSRAIAAGRRSGVPESVIQECFRTRKLTPLRDHLQSANWSQIIEAKPSIWGFTVDLKKVLSIIRRCFGRKETS